MDGLYSIIGLKRLVRKKLNEANTIDITMPVKEFLHSDKRERRTADQL